MPVSLLRLVTALVLVSFLIVSIPAQQTKPSPDEKPRKVKRELKKAYVDWIDNVDPILTQAERDAWKKLQTDEEREQFIADFWRSRDPDPDTEENEFKEEFFERIAYSNEHFSSGTPGRLTDRGRIYIKFGKPDEVESHPAGGLYDRQSYEGGGTTSTYPFEKWFYRYLPNVASGAEFEFVDPTGSGEYRLAKNSDEKDALIHVPGAGSTLAEQLGLETRDQRIANLGNFGRANYTRGQDSQFEAMTLFVATQRDLPFERNFLGNSVSTPIVDDSAINFDTQVNFFRQSDNRVLAILTLQAENDQLQFSDSGGLLTAHLNITGKVTSVANLTAAKFEDSVTTSATAKELSDTRTRKSAYARAFILNPGRYRVDVLVRDIQTGNAGVRHVGFVAPKFPTDTLATSSIILAAKLENMEAGAPLGPFAIGTTKVVPNLTGTYKRGQPVGIYLQVYNAAVDQTTLRPAADAEYVLLKDGKELSKQTEDWRQINDAGQRLTLTRLIDSRNLEPGKYQIQIRIRDHVSGETIAPEASFTVEP